MHINTMRVKVYAINTSWKVTTSCCFLLRDAVSLLAPSVRPSVTLVYCMHTAEDIIKLLSQPGSPIILVF